MTDIIAVAVVANKRNLSRNDAEGWISSVRYSADGMIPRKKIQEMIVISTRCTLLPMRLSQSMQQTLCSKRMKNYLDENGIKYR